MLRAQSRLFFRLQLLVGIAMIETMTPETFEAIKLALAAGCGTAASYLLSMIPQFEELTKKQKTFISMALTCTFGALCAIFLALLGLVPTPEIALEWVQLIYKGASAAFMAAYAAHAMKKKAPTA